LDNKELHTQIFYNIVLQHIKSRQIFQWKSLLSIHFCRFNQERSEVRESLFKKLSCAGQSNSNNAVVVTHQVVIQSRLKPYSLIILISKICLFMRPVLLATDSFTVFITVGKGEMAEGYCLDEENCGGQAVSAIAVQFNAILQSNSLFFDQLGCGRMILNFFIR
jgi:hypothetical protein